MSSENQGNTTEGEATPATGTILDQYVPQTDANPAAEAAVEDDATQDIEEAPAPAVNRNTTGMITISCGAHPPHVFGDIVGKRVGDVLDDLADVLNQDPDSQIIVSGADVSRDYILQPGDRVEVTKQSGNKG